MVHGVRGRVVLGLCLGVGMLQAGPPAGAATIWTGPSIEFSKPAFVSAADPILPGVVELTRGFTQGIYNRAAESVYGPSSPADTEWAFEFNNPGADVEAANHANLSFDSWRSAAGSNPPGRVGEAAVVHIISADVYFDLTFTSWGQGGGSGGSFSYVRSTPAVPEPGTGVLLGLGVVALAARRRIHAPGAR